MLGEQTRYSRLANITKIINTKLELREVLQHVTAAISEEIVQCSSVGIFLPQGDGTFKAYAGKPEVINGNLLTDQVIDPKTDLLAREVIETKKTVYIPDTAKDQRPDRNPVNVLEIKSLLALPISFEQELFGMVFLFDYAKPMDLSVSEIQSVEAYVNMAAVAIQNAKNLAQKENLIAEKQLLLDVTSDLSMCSSLQECIDKCFFYIGKVLDNNDIVAHLLEPMEKKVFHGTKLNKDSTLTEAEWNAALDEAKTRHPYEAIIQHVVQTKEISYVQSQPFKGSLMVPLALMGEVMGIIMVADLAGNAPDYSESQIQLVQSIVDATAPTFSNLLYMDQLENRVEQRTSELALANERVTSVIESITDGFFALNKEWEFIYINKHQYLPKRKSIEDVLGKNIWDIFPEYADTIMYKEFNRAMTERVPVHFEIPSVTETYWPEIVVYPFDEGICCLFKNIAEKKKYEKEFRRLSNLDLIGQMAAGISHEIRNPMTTIRGFLQLLKQENQLDKHDVYFDVMIEELDRANSIITEFLSVGNTRTSDLEMLDLNSIIHDISPLIKIDTFGQNKLIEFDTQDIPELLLNRNEIRQLIINLYRNALDAMDEGKVLTICTYKEDENCVVLGVQDEGEGIQPEVLEKLGTPFYTTKDNGTGLGLGICYAIAARHNAKIEIQTGPEGTTFLTKFYLNNEEQPIS
ncbi:GAF domain-containing sensor histidine kinase [Planococcus shixiaomingii]|uniref:GAF domain-containing sensor histidine kinase n=1 Tax=Planococcus shixiaomingii TaxID=3058393 RepID=UPI00260BC9E7|nr:GAF domain-containing sensor histidine kinase [Planococcus sp. N022]WKA54757.1 GAF domain-containing protein [Planococcus sp. N022]